MWHLLRSNVDVTVRNVIEGAYTVSVATHISSMTVTQCHANGYDA